MNKCQHGEKITHFCVTDNCQHKDGAACELCLKKYHNHITHTTHLTEPQMQNLIKKFALDNTVKPKCRTLQELIYNYFNQIKGEISASLDTVCKNIINQIGYPYLFSIHGISTYKRLKNKEYRKITQREFRAFYQVANQVQDSDLVRQENKIYLQEIKHTNEAIGKLQDVIRSYGQCVRRYHEDFTHQRSEQYKISEMIKSIGQQTSKVHRKSTESSLSESKQMQTLGSSKQEIKKCQPKTTQRNDKITSSILPHQNNRDVSLDRRVVKQHKFKNVQKIVQKTKESQDSQSNLGNKKIQNLKVELNNKEIQINQKKKQLMNIMKHNHTDKPQMDNKISSIQNTPLKVKSIQFTNSVNKQTIESTKLKSFNESIESQQILVIEEYDSEEQVSNFAFTKLPIEQNVKKQEQKHQVKKRMIVIPNLLNLKGINNNKIDALDSPLYKKRIQNNIEQSKNKQQAIDKHFVKSAELQQKQVCRQMLEIKENEQKSLALLLKSLTLSAQQAIIYLQSSLKYADNNLSAAEYLSYLYLQTHRPKQCLTLCNKLIDKIQSTNQPQQISININNNKAAALNVLGRYSQAIMILQKCLKYKEKDTLCKNLGDSYFSIGMHEKAIYNYEKSLKLNGSNDETHYNLSVCLYMQQNYQQSKLQIKKALDLNHKQPLYIELQTFIDAKIKSV